MSEQVFQSSLDEITLDKRFSPWTFLGTKTMIIGKRGCGKNSLAMSIVDKIYDLIDDLYYFSSRIDEYEGVEPYSANDFKLLPKIVETIKLNQRFSKEANEEYHACIVLNDVIYERNMQKEVESLLRDDDSNITIIVMTQYSMGINRSSRESFKHVFVCREDYISNQKRIYDHYFGLMGNFATFKSELTALTGYSTLVKVRNYSDLKDRVFRLNPEFIETERALKLLSNISKIDCSELFDRIDLTELEICKDPNVLLLENSRDKRRRFIKSWCDVEEEKYSKIYYLFDSDDEFLKKDISYSDKLERIGSIVDIRNILKHQSDITKLRRKEECSSIMIVINTALTKDDLKAPEFTTLMFNSRHYRIFLLLASPEDVSLKPEVRCNFDHIILAHDLENKKRMYDYYGGRFPSFNAFNKAFDDLRSTEHLCIDNRGTSTVLEHVKILSECENDFGTIEYILKESRPKLFSIPNPPKCIYRPDVKSNDALKEARMNTINSMLDDIEVDRIMKDIFGQRVIKQTVVADDISWLAGNSDQSDQSDDSDDSNDSLDSFEFDRYLKKSDIEDNSDEIRKQKMQEIQYLTSMISYANSRINTIMQELQ